MTVAELIVKLAALPQAAIVLMESGGLSQVSDLEFIDARGPDASAEVVLAPNTDD